MGERKTSRKTISKAGLAALILLAPGGFILGFTLAARHYRKKKDAADRKGDSAGMEGDADIPNGNNRTS